MKAGARVLQELKDRGDQRDWKVAGHPDPFYANSIHYPGGPWVLPPPSPKLFDPDTIPRASEPFDVDEFIRVIRGDRES